MSIQVFKRHKDLYFYIKSLLPSFDVNKSIPCSRYTFFTEDGTCYKTGNFANMLSTLNDLAGQKVFCTKRSKAIGAFTYKLYLSEDEVIEPATEIKEEAIVQESVDDDCSEVFIPLISLEDIDWDRINSLKGVAEDKDFLDTYAEENFGIKLKKNKKIENMLADFKAGLEAL